MHDFFRSLFSPGNERTKKGALQAAEKPWIPDSLFASERIICLFGLLGREFLFSFCA